MNNNIINYKQLMLEMINYKLMSQRQKYHLQLSVVACFICLEKGFILQFQQPIILFDTILIKYIFSVQKFDVDETLWPEVEQVL